MKVRTVKQFQAVSKDDCNLTGSAPRIYHSLGVGEYAHMCLCMSVCAGDDTINHRS